uniref:RING-type E3 ubiquitin transferase n=1 Tax=Clastoptera arizonana TaxID=38151 RepID=A0A1B6CS47_9HEMI
MENLSLVDMIKALTAIEKTLECIICLDSLKLPVLMCSNNHCVCSSCGKDLKGCPSCQTPLASNIRYPLAFENILKDIPGQCEFSEHCKQFMLGSELREHKKICRYRPISCKIVSCNWKGSFHTLLHHVKTEHQDCLIDNKDGVAVFYDFSPNELYYSVKLVVALNCLFWMYTKNDVTKRKYLVILTYLPLEVIDFTSEIKFATENLKYDYKLRVLNQDVNIDEILSKDYLLFIPSDLLSYFISDKKKLMYKINISENESVIEAQLTENKFQNDNDVKRILTKMDVLCPCCKNILKPPLNTCKNYHSFCNRCEVTTCLLCDTAVTSDRKYPTFVDNLLK